eukprot:6891182-Prymnesium_polylepis.1
MSHDHPCLVPASVPPWRRVGGRCRAARLPCTRCPLRPERAAAAGPGAGVGPSSVLTRDTTPLCHALYSP